MKTRYLLCLLGLSALISSLGVQATDWRQFPEAPDVLLWSAFEDTVPPYFDAQKPPILKDDPLRPGNRVAQLMIPGDWTKAGEFNINFDKSKITLPGAFRGPEVHLYFKIFAKEAGSLNFRVFKTPRTPGLADWDGDLNHTIKISQANQWVPVSVQLGEFRMKTGKWSDIQKITRIWVNYDCGHPVETYIDDFLITAPGTPEAVLPMLGGLDAKSKASRRSPEKDGFFFNTDVSKDWKSTAKPGGHSGRKGHNILVVGSSGQETAKLAEGMTAAKAPGWTFGAAQDPDGNPLGGLDEMRMLLPSSMKKTSPAALLLVLSTQDGRDSKNAERVSVVLQRAVDQGIVPVICLPQNGEAQKNLKAVCEKFRLPYLDSTFVAKANAGSVEGDVFTEKGVSALASFSAGAMKQIMDKMAE